MICAHLLSVPNNTFEQFQNKDHLVPPDSNALTAVKGTVLQMAWEVILGILRSLLVLNMANPEHPSQRSCLHVRGVLSKEEQWTVVAFHGPYFGIYVHAGLHFCY